MRREKFVYNTQTLRYEKVVVPTKVLWYRVMGIVCGILFLLFLGIYSNEALNLVPSPKVKSLQTELDGTRLELEKMQDSDGQIG